MTSDDHSNGDQDRQRAKKTWTSLSGFTPEELRQRNSNRRRELREANLEERRAKDRLYYANNIEERRAALRAGRKKHSAARSVDDKQYYRLTRSNWRKDIAHKVGGARLRAIKKGVPFSLDESWISENVARLESDPRCAATGIEMEPGKGWERARPYPNSPSIDRIDPALGYTPENVRVVCHFVNYAKRDFGNDWVENAVVKWAEQILSARAEQEARETVG